MARDRIVKFRVSEAEYDTVSAKARQSGYSLSGFIRHAMRRARIRHRQDAYRHQLELTRIGTNMNQIARWCNTYKTEADARQVAFYLYGVRQALEALTSARSD